MEFNPQQLREDLEGAANPLGSEFTQTNFRDYLKTIALIQIAAELGSLVDISQSILSVIEDIDQTLNAGSDVSSGAVEAKLITGGIQMSTSAPGTGQITVDTTNSTVTVAFYDDKGDVAAAPAGVTVAFTSDNPAVLTVATDANNPLQGDITPVAEGTANISASITGANDPSGNPFTVNSVQVNVVAGPAATAGLALEVPGQ
jgi:hypothetical protein